MDFERLGFQYRNAKPTPDARRHDVESFMEYVEYSVWSGDSLGPPREEYLWRGFKLTVPMLP